MQARKTEPKGGAVARASEGGHRGRVALALVWMVIAIALVLMRPSVAHAGWPLAGPARVVLGFGSLYSAGEGGSSQHRGVDLAAAAAERVVAPLAGRVSFAGSVPGVGGGRVTAVTIETSRGKITLLPLERATVSRGEQVAEGAAIGTLAESGDGSSAGAHLHVGVREGDLYVDPLGLIAPPPPAPAAGSGAGAGAGVGVQTGAGAGAAVPLDAGVSSGVSLAPRAARGTTRVGGRAKTAAGGELAPGVSIAVPGAAPSGVVVAASGVAHAGSASRVSVAAAGAVQATVLTADGVVVAASAAAPQQSAGWAGLAGLATRARAVAERSVRIVGIVLLGVMAALGALWPLWRGRGGKGSGKVLVSVVREDVAAARSR